MKSKKNLLCAISLCAVASSASAVQFDYDYKLHGRVVGIISVPSTDYPCYIAVDDPSDADHTHYYHAVGNLNSCAMSRLAYATGEKVYLWAAKARGDNNNDAVAIELSDGSENWWR